MNELTRNSPLLRAKGKTKPRAQAGAEEACQFESGRSAPTACKFFVLDVSQIAKELGLPTCNEASDMQQIIDLSTRRPLLSRSIQLLMRSCKHCTESLWSRTVLPPLDYWFCSWLIAMLVLAKQWQSDAGASGDRP